MTRSGIAVLAMRLAAVYIGLWTLLSLADLGWFVGQSSPPGMSLGDLFVANTIVIFLKAILAVVVYLSAPRLAAGLGGDALSEPVEDRLAIGALALRIAGILLWDEALQHVPRVWLVLRGSGYGAGLGNAWLPLATSILLAGFGTLLVLSPQSWSRRLFKTTAERAAEQSVLAQAIAFSVLGLWFLVRIVPGILETIIYAVWRSGSDGSPGFLGLEYVPIAWPSVIMNVLRLALGIVLVLGGGVFARAWHRLRTAGLPQSTARVEPEKT